jgi:pimeloyl-ACP methyl ester carboxylesterase
MAGLKHNRSIPTIRFKPYSILIATLVGLGCLLGSVPPGLALAPVLPAQASPLLLTPTPTPTPTPSEDDTSTDLQKLTGEIQKLTTIIEELKAEIQNLKFQISNLESSNPNPTLAALEELGGQPCPSESDFTCVTLTVPLDHFDPANRNTVDVVFGVLPATGERKGMLVVATGGPGSSGLSAADFYVLTYDPSIPEHFDLVFFDQRGVGASGGLNCSEAVAVYSQTDAQTETPAGEAALLTAAQTFAQTCQRELGVSNQLLPYLGTRQAVEDLELFRQAIGVEQLWLYGESYGTLYAQTYGAVYSDHLAAMILDGTIDPALSSLEFLDQQAQAFNDVLVQTLDACNADPDCAADMGRDAIAVYDDLAAQLAGGPLLINFPLPSGEIAERDFSLADLEAAASNYLYSEGQRMLLQRALAAAAQTDMLPLARLAYESLSLDPETLEPVPDPTFSDALLYAVSCADSDYDTNDPSQSAEAYLRAGDAVDTAVPRLRSGFYGDLPCLFWPPGVEPLQAEPLRAEGIPTLVLGSTADPATPLAGAEEVYRQLADGYLITTEGGPHVTFGWGQACPDDIVTAFLVEGKLPEQRETTCPGIVADAYVPLPPADAAAFENPLEALLSVDTEINYLPEYYYWDVETPTSVGCPHGGTLSFEVGDKGDGFTLTNCAFSAGFAMTGTGLYSYSDASFTLNVTVTGPAETTGELVYVRNRNGAIRVTGEYAGEKVELSEK